MLSFSLLHRSLLVAAGLLLLGTGSAGATDLSYTISSKLKPSPVGQCPAASDDVDADCLDDAMESQLAGVVSPFYMWDESEKCNWYSANDSNTGKGSSNGKIQNIPRYYYQVRPIKKLGAPAGYPVLISKWQADAGWIYWVRVHFFINYPTDCGSPGHQGDNEGFFMDLYSTNLTNWAIGTAWFPRHSNPGQLVPGADLQHMAAQASVSYPIVLADVNGHGAWEGVTAFQDACGVGATGNIFINYYCVAGATIVDGIGLGNYVFPSIERNIGEPEQAGSTGLWNKNVMSVFTATGVVYAYTTEDTGQGAIKEYWSNVAGTPYRAYDTFCGWQCKTRKTSNSCSYVIQGKGECTGASMWSKVEKAPYNRF